MLLRLDEPDVCAYVTGQVAQRIRSLRDARGLTVGEMADFMGVTRPSYYQYASAERCPSVCTLWRLAMAFDLPWDDLMPGRALIMRAVGAIDPDAADGPEDEPETDR